MKISLCVGVDADAVGEDDQAEGGGDGDDEALAPGGEFARPGGCCPGLVT